MSVAVAPDALAAAADIAPDDFQVMDVTYIDDSFGAICVDGEVRTGYRMKLVVSCSRQYVGIQLGLQLGLDSQECPFVLYTLVSV